MAKSRKKNVSLANASLDSLKQVANQPVQPNAVQPSSVQRETVESIVIAVILAFLFRGFVAEAFIIPTGSMAPTLMGRHKDLVCTQCGYQFQAGDSEERQAPQTTVAAMCPMCRFTQRLDVLNNMDHDSFSGDRILVSKFSYDMENPNRWDVIVFKWPNNAKQNYIKRLIGLPGETIRVRHGDIWLRKAADEKFRIARKPPHKIKAMLQDVHDTRHLPLELHKAGFPSRWNAAIAVDQGQWKTSDYGATYEVQPTAGRDTWLRYRHITPTERDWEALGESPPPDFSNRDGRLIDDFYAYNAFIALLSRDVTQETYDVKDPLWDVLDKSKGLHWVGDLALEAEVEILTSEGELLLDLVEAGRHHMVRIDVKTGKATLSIDGGQVKLGVERPVDQMVADTKLQGPGKHKLRFSNLDNQLVLWIDERVISFDEAAAYRPPVQERPVWTPNDPGDLAPVGIGSRGLKFKVDRLRVLRDVYYIAGNAGDPITDYAAPVPSPSHIRSTLADHERWDTTPLFNNRDELEFSLKEDQFFPLGDNSPQSYDARSWEGTNHVDRKLMIGKALFIYWPHPLYHPVPFFPNFSRMRLIR